MTARTARLGLNHALEWSFIRLPIALALAIAGLLAVDLVRPGLAAVANATMVLLLAALAFGVGSLVLWLALAVLSARTRRDHRRRHGT